mmetsp:Transcript_5613/g.9329  ORF Transcript_5613/g.9329 Transcript_5613/m.9329 type:complete len:870 (-) Transcript_5613:13-2622(-)
MTLNGSPHFGPKRPDLTEDVLDRLSIYTIRMLCADMVENASSGHLGAPFGCAPLANALWGHIMKFSPRKRWINRDRFVLSNGHASAMLYTMLHLTGQGLGGPYEVSIDALKQFRQAGSQTPGHPEFRMTSGVEVTTGPLGQGFANAVGMAIAEAHMAARFNREGHIIFDHYIYVLAGDGCLMEGVVGEASSLAGHLQLHKLIVFYDDNKITIDGSTDLAFTEDVPTVFRGKGWNVLEMEKDPTDTQAFVKIVEEAKSQTEKPTLIVMPTTIGAGAGKGLEGSHKAHGGKFPPAVMEALRQKWFSVGGLKQSEDEVDQKLSDLVQKELHDLKSWGMANNGETLPKFYIPRKVLQKFRNFGERGDDMADEWEQRVEEYIAAFRESEPEVVKDLQGRISGQYLSHSWKVPLQKYLDVELERIHGSLGTLSNDPAKLTNGLTRRPSLSSVSDKFKHKAGRVCASEVLQAFVQANPSVIGGSGDVGSSCGGFFPKLQGIFLPKKYASRIEHASYAGRYINFGVREHAALAILNGLSSYSGLIPYCTLFTIFYQYGMPAMRMASISKFPILYIGTHDSIDLGEDGPTHQPVEVLPQLRAMPNVLVIRPACVSEMVGAFTVFAEQYDTNENQGSQQYVDPKPLRRRPVFLMTSRGELGLPFKGNTQISGAQGVAKGAYVIHDCYDHRAVVAEGGTPRSSPKACLPDIVLIASGQDVALVMKTKELLLDWSAKMNEQLTMALKSIPGALSVTIPSKLKIRVVSMPCWELFDEEDQTYQDSVLLSNYDDILRIYVEKAATKNTGHDKYAHFSVLMPSYGLSGKAADVERKLEFTEDYIAAKIWDIWNDRGRRLPQEGDEADIGPQTWVSRLGRRLGAH